MLELCLVSQHNNIFFVVLFLQRLPREIRVLLTHEDHPDLRRLAAHADSLVVFGGRQAGDDTVEDLEESTMIHPRQRQAPSEVALQAAAATVAAAATGQPAFHSQPTAIKSAGLCFYHWCHGDTAHQCKPPCSWHGN